MGMKERLKAGFAFLLARLQEASTWAGLSAVLGLFHFHTTDATISGLTALGTGLAGLAAAMMRG